MSAPGTTTLARQLDALGWGGVPFGTVFPHLVLLYLNSGLDAGVPLRAIRCVDGDQPRASCERAALAMIRQADEADRLRVLERPQIRPPEDVLAMLERRFGGAGEVP